MALPVPLLAVDIGNSRTKFGLFAGATSAGAATEALPAPLRMLELPSADWDPAALLQWLDGLPFAAPLTWVIASVNRASTARLLRWLNEVPRAGTLAAQPRLLTSAVLRLEISVEQPELVGIDRLLGAVAANALRAPDAAAIVLALGTALTVNFVSATGAFCGGAILPGIGMSARALHDFTDQLPLVPMTELHDPPPAVGNSTHAALRAGLYWGAVGAMRELIAQMSRDLPRPTEIYLTGGAAPHVAAALGPAARHVPHLILGAIALTVVGEDAS